jgi:hypothetical protein
MTGAECQDVSVDYTQQVVLGEVPPSLLPLEAEQVLHYLSSNVALVRSPLFFIPPKK